MRFIIPLLFGTIYWWSGTPFPDRLQKKLGNGWLIKFLVQRKTLMALGVFITLLIFSNLKWYTSCLPATAMFLVHFCGWWENRWMSILRGVIEWLPLLLVYLLVS